MTITYLIPISLILLIMSFVKLHGFISVVVFGGIYTLIYCIVAYAITMNKYEKSIVDKVLYKIKLKKV